MNLIRPVDFQTVMVADAAGQSAFRAVLFTVPISVVAGAALPGRPPASVAAGVAVPAVRRRCRSSSSPRLELPRRPDRDPHASRSSGILRAKYLVARAPLGAPDPDDALPAALAVDPPGLAVPPHQLHARPRSTSGRRRDWTAAKLLAPPGGLDRGAAGARAVGLAPLARADHDPGGMTVLRSLAAPRPPLRALLLAVREGAARVPRSTSSRRCSRRFSGPRRRSASC